MDYSSTENKESSETIKLRFDSIYENIPEAYYSENIEDDYQLKEVEKTGGNPIYGEMLYESIEEVILKDFEANSSDIFMDLGSGSGKAPIEFTLLTGGKSIGLEFVLFRHQLALQAYIKLPTELKCLVYFLQGDIFNFILPKATIYMIDALMFPHKFPEIVEILMKYGPKKFRVWSIGATDLPFSQEYVAKHVQKSFSATWDIDQITHLYWIEK